MNKFRMRVGKLEVVAFVSGFALMVFELAGARILAPGIGSSTYVWTSVIGVIIAALSLGYWIGGRVADKRGYMIDIARLCLFAALLVVMMMLQYEGVIGWVAEAFDDPRWQGVVASLLLFAPTSFVLGMISPYLAKMNVRSLKSTGRSIASLSALNSVGGIVGTFAAGFILFGYIGSHETVALVALLMVGVSWLAAPHVQWKPRAILSAVVFVIVFLTPQTAQAISIDTPSARYTIAESNGLRLLATGPYAAQSGVDVTQPDRLAFWYTQQLADVVAHAPSHDNILILGGGAFTLPQYLANKYPVSNIDVVEIDPELANIAREHFYYDDPANVNLLFTDARTYVNQTNKKYDVVIVDVYGDAHVPFTLLTREYGSKIAAITKPNGVVAANLIAGTMGACGTLFDALNAPYRSQFTYAMYRIDKPDKTRSNMVAAYTRQPFTWPAALTLGSPATAPYSDNYAPADRLQQDCRLQDTR